LPDLGNIRDQKRQKTMKNRENWPFLASGKVARFSPELASKFASKAELLEIVDMSRQ